MCSNCPIGSCCYYLTDILCTHITNCKNTLNICFSGFVGNDISVIIKCKLIFKDFCFILIPSCTFPTQQLL